MYFFKKKQKKLIRFFYFYFPFCWRLAPRRMKSGLGIEKYDVCSNKHCSSTMCAIISLKVWIDINCAQTVDLKTKIVFCLFPKDLHRFIHILIRFFFGKKPYFLRPKISVFLRKYFFFYKKSF